MAATSKVAKAISYRRCVISPKPSQNLQQLLSAAFVLNPKPGDRVEPLNAAGTELRVIGNTTTKQSCLCGFLSTYERGASQPVISDDMTAARLRLSSLPPPAAKKGSAQQQFIPGVLYFVVYGNHCVLVQSLSYRAKALEAHFNWLLKSKTSQLKPSDAFALSDEAQKATKAKIRGSHVKSISLGQALMTEVATPKSQPSANVPAERTAAPPSRFRPSGPALEFLRNYFNDESQFEKLGLDEIFDGNLEFWIEIRYPKRQRSQPEDAIQLMDTLGIALRDIDGDQVDLKLANGHKVSGSELKISGNVEVSLLSNHIPDESLLFDAMIDWLSQQISNGVVDD